MRIKLIRIGNSLGIRLPKNIIQGCDFQNEIEMSVENKKVILSAPHDDRTAWFELFQESVKQRPIREGKEWEW